MKKTLAFIMAILTTFTALSFGACNGAGTSDTSTGKEQVVVPEKQPESNITATIVRPDQTYNFCSEIAFLGSDLAATSESGYEAVSAELVATVEPIDANQNVNWAVSFKNASSTWANGKAVSDYVTVTPKSAGSTTATVTCKAPFGEQIVITCTSQDNPNIYAECTVDFIEAITHATLTFGENLPVNLGGQTEVKWEVNPSAPGVGGNANVEFESTDYTIPNNFAWRIDLFSPTMYTGQASSSFFSLNDQPVIYSYCEEGEQGLPTEESDQCVKNITELVFNHALFQKIGAFIDHRTNPKVLYELSTAELISNYFSTISSGNLWTLKISFIGEQKSESFTSLLNVIGYTNTSEVKSISLTNSALKF